MPHVLGKVSYSKFRDVHMHSDSNNTATHCVSLVQNYFSDAEFVVLDSLANEKDDAYVPLADVRVDYTSVSSVD